MFLIIKNYCKINNVKLIQNVRNLTINNLYKPLNNNSNKINGPNLSSRAKTLRKFQEFPYIEIYRNKYSKNNKNDDDSDYDSDGEDFKNLPFDTDPNLIKVRVNSLRADLILKAGLGLARNKVETIFYESKIRVNGEKILKKSLKLNVGDEIDIIKGINVENPDHIQIARVEILAAVPKNDTISVALRRNKSMNIENYVKENAWKAVEKL